MLYYAHEKGKVSSDIYQYSQVLYGYVFFMTSDENIFTCYLESIEVEFLWLLVCMGLLIRLKLLSLFVKSMFKRGHLWFHKKHPPFGFSFFIANW